MTLRLVSVLALLLLLTPTLPAHAAGEPPCAPDYARGPLTLCAGRATGRDLLELLELGLPPERPSLEVEPIKPERGVLRHVYGRVARDEVFVYAHPADYFAGRPPVRSLGTGFVFVSVQGETEFGDETFIQVNKGEYVLASDLKDVRTSTFRGQTFASPPSGTFGWVIASFQLRRSPGADAQAGDPWLPRYATIQVHGAQYAGGWLWYLVGPDQWIEQRAVALASPVPPMAMPGRLIVVDIYEQTLVAFENGQAVFATLMSSGLAANSTPPGLYHVYSRLEHGRMDGAFERDRSDYYYLEDVPYILYFDGDRALHGAYWHDAFGSKRSHGCVNLSPNDSKWVFEFAPMGTPVLVISSAPSGASSN